MGLVAAAAVVDDVDVVVAAAVAGAVVDVEVGVVTAGGYHCSYQSLC